MKLDLARAAAAEKRLANVEFRVENVNDWSAPNSYDVVFCRFVLQHLSRPLDLLRRMWEAVRAGGALAVEDADFSGYFCEPPNDAFEFYSRMYRLVLARYGGDPAAARKLYGYFLEAGIPDPHLKLVQGVHADDEAKRLPLLTLEATSKPIVSEGLASGEEVRSAMTSLADYTNDPTTLVSDPRIFQVWARRT